MKERLFSASAIAEFLTCRQKYFLNRVLRVTTPKREMALEFGHSLHKAIDSLHQDGWDAKKAKEAFDADFTEDPTDTKRTRVVAHTIIERYHTAYREQPFKMVHQGFAFRLSVPEAPNVELRGEIDRVVDWSGRIMVDEFKSTSQLTADYLKRFWVDYQTTIYLIAAKQLVDKRISAVLADAALVAKSDPKTLKSEPLLRDIIERSDEELAYMRNRLVQIILDMDYVHTQYESGANDLWYENDQSCTNFGGCKYLSYCRTSPRVRSGIIATGTELVPRTQDVEVERKFADCLVGEFKLTN